MTYREFAEMIARLNTEEELEALECEDISSDCIETLGSLIEKARELTGIRAPVIEELRESLAEIDAQRG